MKTTIFGFVLFLSHFLICVSAIGEGVLDLNALLGIFSGMANIFRDVNTTDIHIDKMMGRWHQMYKAAINFDVFQTNMYCEVAYFSRNKVMGRDGFSMEEAYHVVVKNGPIEVYKRDITKTGTGEFWMYTEEYFYPRQFYILKVGPVDPESNSSTPYEYLVATDSNRLALMVFARDPLLFHQLYDKELQAFLSKQGFGGYVFWNQPVAIYQGSDCYYPSEQEVFARRAVKGNGEKRPKPGLGPLNFGLPLPDGSPADVAGSAGSQSLTSEDQSSGTSQNSAQSPNNDRDSADLQRLTDALRQTQNSDPRLLLKKNRRVDQSSK